MDKTLGGFRMKQQMLKKLTALSIIALMLCMLLLGCTGVAKDNTPAANRLEQIKKRGYIEIATEPHFAPFQFIDPTKNGEERYAGSDIELAKYIADKLGVELRLVPLEFSAVLAGVSEGKYDLALSALAYTPARAEAMNLTNGYFFSEQNEGHGLLIRKEDADNIKSIEDVSSKTIVYQSGSLQEMFVEQQVPSCKEVKKVSSTTDGFLMVQNNKADVCATAIGTARLYIEANPNSDLMVVPNVKFSQDKSTDGVRIGIKKGEDALTDAINEIIYEVLESGIYNDWYQKYDAYARTLGL